MSERDLLTVGMLVCIQGLGLASAVLARLSEGRPSQGLFRRGFFCLLAVVGASAWIATKLGPGLSLMSGASLATMTLVTCWDVSRPRRGLTPC